jgi:hypothetical protein
MTIGWCKAAAVRVKSSLSNRLSRSDIGTGGQQVTERHGVEDAGIQKGARRFRHSDQPEFLVDRRHPIENRLASGVLFVAIRQDIGKPGAPMFPDPA